MLKLTSILPKIILITQNPGGLRGKIYFYKKNRQVEHTNLINNYDHEIQILSQVDTALARGGIQRNN